MDTVGRPPLSNTYFREENKMLSENRALRKRIEDLQAENIMLQRNFPNGMTTMAKQLFINEMKTAIDKYLENEKPVRDFSLQISYLSTSVLFLYLSMKVMRIIDVRNLFPSLHQHALDTTPVNAEIHSVSLVKLLVFRFFKVRCLSYLKLLNSKNTEETSIRNSILKQILFKGL